MASLPSGARPGETALDALSAQLLLSLYYGAEYPPGFLECWIQVNGQTLDLEMPCMVVKAWTGQTQLPMKEGWTASADGAAHWFSFAGPEEWIAIGLCSRPCTQARCMAMAQAFLAGAQETPHGRGPFSGYKQILYYPNAYGLSKPGRGIQLNERAVAHPAVSRTITYLHAAYATDFSLSDLSCHCGMTESYLCKLFKQNTGITLTEYLCRLRMEKAKALLREGKYRVCQIGPMVGYKNPAYFHRLFKQREQLTPIAYRMRERYASANSG